MIEPPTTYDQVLKFRPLPVPSLVALNHTLGPRIYDHLQHPTAM